MAGNGKAVLPVSISGVLAFLLSTSSLPGQSRVVLPDGYGKLPLSFEANQGQTDPQVHFLSRGHGYSLFLTDSEAVLLLGKRDRSKGDVVRMQLAGTDRGLHVSGIDQLPGRANYFIGNDPAKWHSALPTYGKVKYASVYPGVDLVYYGNQRQLEYDFLLAPHADPKRIKLHFAGARELKLNSDGALLVTAKNGRITFHKPVVYQEKNGQRELVDGRFKLLADKTIGFAVGNYDHTRGLVIDPTLEYSTYLGGSDLDYGYSIAVDSAGNAYVTGWAQSQDFPVTGGAFQTLREPPSPGNPPGNIISAFVTKLNASGTALIYSTYLGGNFVDTGASIAVDTAGNAYVTGTATSTDFPVTASAFQSINNAAFVGSNTFVTKLNSAGTALVYSTYLGGSGADQGWSITVDAAGDAYVAGSAASADFPVTAGAFQSVNKAISGGTNVFVSKLNSAGTSLIYSTYLGGSGTWTGSNASGDIGYGIALDTSGNAYITGQTSSSDFPVSNEAFQTIDKSAAIDRSNAFAAKLNPAGTALVYSTYLGGSEDASGRGIAVDASRNAYVTGGASPDFPVTSGAFQTVGGGVFVTKLNAAGTGLIYSTFLGGADGNSDGGGFGIALDASGNAYVAGLTTSSHFPVTGDAVQSVNNGIFAAFLTQLNSTGSTLIYSTYLGGSYLPLERGNGIAVDSFGAAYVVGSTASLALPVTSGAFQTVNKSAVGGVGGYQAFVAKFGLGSTGTGTSATETSTLVTSDSNPQNAGVNITFTAYVQASSGSGIPTGTITFSVDGISESSVALDGTGHANYATSTLSAGPHAIAAAYSGDATYSPSSGSLTETILAASGSVALFGNLTGKSGPSNARVWSIQVDNSGSATAIGAQISNVSLTQVGGAACTPVVTAMIPALAGDLAAGASVTVPVIFDFSACAGNARFTANVALSANAGAATGSIVRLNQFQ